MDFLVVVSLVVVSLVVDSRVVDGVDVDVDVDVVLTVLSFLGVSVVAGVSLDSVDSNVVRAFFVLTSVLAPDNMAVLLSVTIVSLLVTCGREQRQEQFKWHMW